MAKINVTALVMFIIVGLIAGIVSPYLSDALGATGMFATMIFLTLFFAAFAYLTKEKLGIANYAWFVVFGILAMFINSYVTEALGLATSAIASTVVFCVIFFGLWTYLKGKGKRVTR